MKKQSDVIHFRVALVSKAAAEVGVKRVVSKSRNFGYELVSTVEALVGQAEIKHDPVYGHC